MTQTSGPGQIVILNGVPRSGKSSIVTVIQETFDGPWMNLGVDTFKERVMSQRYSPGIGLRPGAEFPSLEPLVAVLIRSYVRVRRRPQPARPERRGRCRPPCGYSTPLGILADCARRLMGLPVLFVEVHCPVEVIWERYRNTWLKEQNLPADAPVPGPGSAVAARGAQTRHL